MTEAPGRCAPNCYEAEQRTTCTPQQHKQSVQRAGYTPTCSWPRPIFRFERCSVSPRAPAASTEPTTHKEKSPTHTKTTLLHTVLTTQGMAAPNTASAPATSRRSNMQWALAVLSASPLYLAADGEAVKEHPLLGTQEENRLNPPLTYLP